MRQNIVDKLTEMLDAAKSGKVTHLAYHYDNDGTEHWGQLNLSSHGKLVTSARLSAMSLEEDDSPND